MDVTPVLEIAIDALIRGDAVVSDDGNEVRWPEWDREADVDYMAGISRCEGRWVPLVEVGAPI